eukprot:960366_1
MKVNWNRVAARSTIIKHKGRIRIQSQQSHIASVNAIIQSNPHSPINDILHTYISHHHSSPNEVFLIWDDIIKTNEIQNANLSEALVIKTVAKTLKMCLSQTETKKCIQMLQYLLSNHTLQDDVNVYCLLIRAFSLHADIHGAEDTFYALPKHKINLRLITSLMNAYVHNQHYHKAIALYKQFPNVTHNDTSHTLCIKACQNTRNYEYAHQIITQHIHYLDGDHSEQLFNTLIHFYGTFNRIFLAEKVFAFIPIHKRNVIHVNTMMNAYVKNGLMDKCLQFYESNTVKDHVTHSSALKACIKCNHFSLGHQIIKQHIGYNHTQCIPMVLSWSILKIIEFVAPLLLGGCLLCIKKRGVGGLLVLSLGAVFTLCFFIGPDIGLLVIHSNMNCNGALSGEASFLNVDQFIYGGSIAHVSAFVIAGCTAAAYVYNDWSGIGYFGVCATCCSWILFVTWIVFGLLQLLYI